MQTNIQRVIDFYNSELERWSTSDKSADIENFINPDATRISWTRALKADLRKEKPLAYTGGRLILASYRPFTRQWQYYSRRLNEMVYQMPCIFPNAAAKNRVMITTGVGSRSGFACLMSDCMIDFNAMEAGAQCFPLYLYEAKSSAASTMDSMFASSDDPMDGYTRKDGITDDALRHFQQHYADATISREDIFYYIYGLLHSPDYRNKYADNLSKQLARIPCTQQGSDFRAFAEIGRKLAELHVGYEQLELYPVTFTKGNPATTEITDPKQFYRVTKMRFGKDKDQSTIIYNDNITISDIPLAAYDYQVNGRSAIEWVMDRQLVKTDKASGIVNDANDYANDTMHNPAYPLELLQKVITLSLKTNEYIAQMPELD